MVHLFPDRDEPDRIELRGNARDHRRRRHGRRCDRWRPATSTSTIAKTAGRCSRPRWPGRPRSSWRRKDGIGRAAAERRVHGHRRSRPTAASSSLVEPRQRRRHAAGDRATPPARTIRSTRSRRRAPTAQGLTAMKFSEGVEYREAATKDAGARIGASAQRSRPRSTPGSGALQEAHVHRRLRFDDGPMRATSDEAALPDRRRARWSSPGKERHAAADQRRDAHHRRRDDRRDARRRAR